MKQKEFVQWLLENGVEIKNGKKHLKLYLNGKQSTLNRNPSEELTKGLIGGIKKQLDLK